MKITSLALLVAIVHASDTACTATSCSASIGAVPMPYNSIKKPSLLQAAQVDASADPVVRMA